MQNSIWVRSFVSSKISPREKFSRTFYIWYLICYFFGTMNYKARKYPFGKKIASIINRFIAVCTAVGIFMLAVKNMQQ